LALLNFDYEPIALALSQAALSPTEDHLKINNEPRGVASGTNRASEVMDADSLHPELGNSGSWAAAPGNYTWAGSRRRLAPRPEHEV